VRYVVALVFAAAVGALLFAEGVPAPVVYVVRSLLRHFIYLGGH
jgi:hypothetical protein